VTNNRFPKNTQRVGSKLYLVGGVMGNGGNWKKLKRPNADSLNHIKRRFGIVSVLHDKESAKFLVQHPKGGKRGTEKIFFPVSQTRKAWHRVRQEGGRKKRSHVFQFGLKRKGRKSYVTRKRICVKFETFTVLDRRRAMKA